jgi:hypothetical protein
VDPSTGNVLGTANTADSTLADTGPVTLPSDGSYVVRIHAMDDTQGSGNYQFTLQ